MSQSNNYIKVTLRHESVVFRSASAHRSPGQSDFLPCLPGCTRITDWIFTFDDVSKVQSELALDVAQDKRAMLLGDFPELSPGQITLSIYRRTPHLRGVPMIGKTRKGVVELTAVA